MTAKAKIGMRVMAVCSVPRRTPAGTAEMATRTPIAKEAMARPSSVAVVFGGSGFDMRRIILAAWLAGIGVGSDTFFLLVWQRHFFATVYYPS